MKSLPNNCRRGNISIHPANWKDCGAKGLKENWYIKYRFYDGSGQTKQVMISRFNKYDNLKDRRTAIDEALTQLNYELEYLGYNPISGNTQKPAITPENEEINKWTPFIESLNYAKSKMQVSESTMKNETEWVLKWVGEAAKSLKYDAVPIWDITLKHLYLICEKASYKADKSYSGAKFNRNKKVLRQLYKKLLMLEVVQANFPLSLERQKEPARKKKVVLTTDERKKLIEHLEKSSPRFLLFIQIFFHSGARRTEMLRVKVSDVDFKRQVITYLVMKGKRYEYKERPMKDIAVQYWKEAIKGGKSSDYVFSGHLGPGSQEIPVNVIKLRWQRLCKKLNINTGIYSLKHLNTTETKKLIGTKGAAIQNAESEEMIKKHYDIEHEQDENELIRGVNNPL